MYYPTASPNRLLEFDAFYDTRTNGWYRVSRIGLLSGICLIAIGFVLFGLSIGDMSRGYYNHTGTRAVLTWWENPIWPTYGKGVWVGLLCVAVGILGILAHRECTHTTIKIFSYSALVLALLLFYLMISAIKEVRYGEVARRSVTHNTFGIYNTYALNSSMIAFAVLGFLISIVAAIFSLKYTDIYFDSRPELLKA